LIEKRTFLAAPPFAELLVDICMDADPVLADCRPLVPAAPNNPLLLPSPPPSRSMEVTSEQDDDRLSRVIRVPTGGDPLTVSVFAFCPSRLPEDILGPIAKSDFGAVGGNDECDPALLVPEMEENSRADWLIPLLLLGRLLFAAAINDEPLSSPLVMPRLDPVAALDAESGRNREPGSSEDTYPLLPPLLGAALVPLPDEDFTDSSDCFPESLVPKYLDGFGNVDDVGELE
jgi:hypothetical protein